MGSPAPRRQSGVLIVDDQLANLKVLGTVLREEHEVSEVYIARSGAEALKIAGQVRPDLILLDVMMPGLDGYEVCRQLKADEATRATPVIFLTARVESEDLVAGFEAGAVDYIRKPFQAAELRARVRLHLELKHSRDEIQRIGRERKDLIHLLCHDLRAPFSSMDAIIAILREAPEQFEAERERYTQMAADTVHNGLKTIDLVRAMHSVAERLFEPGSGLELESVGLRSAAEIARMVLRDQWQRKSVRVEIDVPPELTVRAESTSLSNSVLVNLIGNAIKFSHEGGVVRVRARTPADADQPTRVEIIDEGIGMPPEIRERLFEPGSSTTRPGTQGESGTGFGMPLVQRFVTAYGGQIEIESSESSQGAASGTTMVLSLQNGGDESPL